MTSAVDDQLAKGQLTKGQQWLTELLRLSGLTVPVVGQVFAVAPEPVGMPLDSTLPSAMGWLTIGSETLSPEQVSLLVGDHGQVIDSIQYLANLLLNLESGDVAHLPFTVDINNYRATRLEALQTLTQSAVDQVQEKGVECELTGLSSAERRQVHTLLTAFPMVESFSRGVEPDRRLVVCPRGLSPTH
ncbi:R3H domain-containing nucleic acid-binding protein [Prochlorothrix hollandica]|uniref:R3H domain-containing protein n=1 Tax=Prochlorothrix hollandica PCC 9006 = CALU 1027 TaxID=317619 RepID=A0A0M2PUQ4_PROHO|nr:R3H domain-containing nucleic acid-binding protein [Prochlorothrix hollandica]KKI98116.1 hypothetical protein PROH_20630 [Prochlorothrix hollandica PCC 9006 = CALU 1027]